MKLPPWVEALSDAKRRVLQRAHDNARHRDARVPWEVCARTPTEEAAAEELLRDEYLTEPTLGILELTENGRAAAAWLERHANERLVTTPSCPTCGMTAKPEDITPGGMRAACRNTRCRTESYFTSATTLVMDKVPA